MQNACHGFQICALVLGALACPRAGSADDTGYAQPVGLRRICPGKQAQTYYYADAGGQKAGIWQAETLFEGLELTPDRRWILARRNIDGAKAWIETANVCNLDEKRVICKTDSTGLHASDSPGSATGRTISRGQIVQLSGAPSNGMARVLVGSETFWVWTNYLCYHDSMANSAGASGNSPFCRYTWEERPGTTDYTTIDRYRSMTYSRPDRSENQTLVGSGVQQRRNLCERAKALRHCFDRAILQNDEVYAKRFRDWARTRNVDPVLALMAKTQQETGMGSVYDSCSGGSCNGIGLSQIISAYAPDGSPLRTNDTRWEGITFNILTNLHYSVRVISVKIPNASSLYDLAYAYNGSGSAGSYASNVVSYYGQLQRCGL